MHGASATSGKLRQETGTRGLEPGRALTPGRGEKSRRGWRGVFGGLVPGFVYGNASRPSATVPFSVCVWVFKNVDTAPTRSHLGRRAPSSWAHIFFCEGRKKGLPPLAELLPPRITSLHRGVLPPGAGTEARGQLERDSAVLCVAVSPGGHGQAAVLEELFSRVSGAGWERGSASLRLLSTLAREAQEPQQPPREKENPGRDPSCSSRPRRVSSRRVSSHAVWCSGSRGGGRRRAEEGCVVPGTRQHLSD